MLVGPKRDFVSVAVRYSCNDLDLRFNPSLTGLRDYFL